MAPKAAAARKAADPGPTASGLRSRALGSAVLITSLACLGAGCGEGEDVSPSFEDRVPPGLELSTAQRVLEWGESTRLEGRLTQGDEELSGETVVLEADPYPFQGDFEELETIETDEDGGFEFEASPEANTAYRVAAGELSETTSPDHLVFVEPRRELEVEPAGGGTRYTTVFRHPDERSIQGSSFFSYASAIADAEATGKLNFIQVDRIEQTRPGLSEASIVLPFAAEEIRYSSCVSYTGDSGMGSPNTRCSQSSIPTR